MAVCSGAEDPAKSVPVLLYAADPLIINISLRRISFDYDEMNFKELNNCAKELEEIYK